MTSYGDFEIWPVFDSTGDRTTGTTACNTYVVYIRGCLVYGGSLEECRRWIQNQRIEMLQQKEQTTYFYNN
jgi:hypothetical protein